MAVILLFELLGAQDLGKSEHEPAIAAGGAGGKVSDQGFLVDAVTMGERIAI